jgi:hypothetical protein
LLGIVALWGALGVLPVVVVAAVVVVVATVVVTVVAVFVLVDLPAACPCVAGGEELSSSDPQAPSARAATSAVIALIRLTSQMIAEVGQRAAESIARSDWHLESLDA